MAEEDRHVQFYFVRGLVGLVFIFLVFRYVKEPIHNFFILKIKLFCNGFQCKSETMHDDDDHDA